MLVLPPALARVLDAADRFSREEAGAGEVREAVAGARAFVREGRRLLEVLSAAILRSERVAELLLQARRDLDRQDRALDQVENSAAESRRAAAAEAASHLKAASASLQEALRGLEAEERAEPPLSPFPDLDAFLKTVVNTLDGHLAAAAVAHRFPAAAGRVARLGAVLPGDAALEEMEAGLGAVSAFLETGERTALEDGLRLLARGSQDLHPRYQALGDLPFLKALEDSWPWAEEALDEHAARLEGVRLHPVRALVEVDESPATRALAEARAAVAARDAAAAPAAFERLHREVQAVAGRLEERLRPVREAPLLADLQLVVGRALLGQMPGGELREVLDHVRAQQAHLASELQQSAGQMDPAEADRLQGLLMRQSAGCERMAHFLGDGRPEHLREGWALVEEAAGPLAEIAAAMRERLSRPAGPAGPTCLRCGAANATGARYCKACNAVLPALTQEVTDYTDITGGSPEAAGAVPAHVARLEALVRRVDAGEAGPEEVAAGVDDLLERAERVRQAFESHPLPQDATVLEYARFFEEQMGLYLDGLLTVRLYAETGVAEHLTRGLEACRQAGHELTAMKERIEAAMRG